MWRVCVCVRGWRVGVHRLGRVDVLGHHVVAQRQHTQVLPHPLTPARPPPRPVHGFSQLRDPAETRPFSSAAGGSAGPAPQARPVQGGTPATAGRASRSCGQRRRRRPMTQRWAGRGGRRTWAGHAGGARWAHRGLKGGGPGRGGGRGSARRRRWRAGTPSCSASASLLVRAQSPGHASETRIRVTSESHPSHISESRIRVTYPRHASESQRVT